MNRALSPVDDALRVSHRERELIALVPGIRGDADVVLADPIGHLRPVDLRVVTAVADHVQPAAPMIERQPDLETDEGSRHGVGEAMHAAESRQIGIVVTVRIGVGLSE